MDQLDTPTLMDKIKKAIPQVTSDRASGKDRIPDEVYKTVGPNALEVFHDILLSIWEDEMSEDFHDAMIVTLYKNKSSKAE